MFRHKAVRGPKNAERMREYRRKKRQEKEKGKQESEVRARGVEQQDRTVRESEVLDELDRRQARMLDAVGTSLEDLENHDMVLGRMKALERATTLAQAALRAKLCPRGAHWDKRVDELERLLDYWKRKWDGMAHWAERRHMMETGLLVDGERKEYEQHIECGTTILNGSHMLFSWLEGVRIPEDLALVSSLYCRSTNIAVEVSTGLERLSIYKYQQGL
jgi:hypothetical protein